MNGSFLLPVLGIKDYIPPPVNGVINSFLHDPILIVLFIAFFVFFLILWLRPFWRLYRSVPGGRTFQFKIIDYWAVMLGLAPTFVLVSDAIRTPSAPAWLTAIMVGVSQISGIFIGRVHNVLPPKGERKSEWEEAGWILLGAIFGLALLPMGFVTFMMLPVIFLLAAFFSLFTKARNGF